MPGSGLKGACWGVRQPLLEVHPGPGPRSSSSAIRVGLNWPNRPNRPTRPDRRDRPNDETDQTDQIDETDEIDQIDGIDGV